MDRPWSRLNLILDHDVAVASGWTVPDLARVCFEAGARFVQVRAKGLASDAFLDACDAVVDLATTHEALCVVNDRVDLALSSGAGGVHVGQDDLAPEDIRRMAPELAVGYSTHTRPQIAAALSLPIDYLAVGPVFGSRTKTTEYDPVGRDLVRRAVGTARERSTTTPVRVVAIGGVTVSHAVDLVADGVAAVAVISDVFATGDPAARVREYLDALGE